MNRKLLVVQAMLVLILSVGCTSAPRRYTCQPRVGAITIDGRLDEDAWRYADWTEPFIDIEGAKRPHPRHATRAKMCWDSDFLYVAAVLEEPDVCAMLTERDAIVYHDNDFELFIDPDGDGRNYYEVEINARNTIFDLLLVRTYRQGGPALHDWDLAGLVSAVHVEGTLNDPRDTDRGWSLEMAMPWSALAGHTTAAAPPRPGDTWRVNMSRVQWLYDTADGRYAKISDRREDNWVWSPQGEINMHAPEMWGHVMFNAR